MESLKADLKKAGYGKLYKTMAAMKEAYYTVEAIKTCKNSKDLEELLKNIADVEITLSGDKFKHTGEEICPEVTVKVWIRIWITQLSTKIISTQEQDLLLLQVLSITKERLQKPSLSMKKNPISANTRTK